MSVKRKNQTAYGIGSPLVNVFNAPIVSTRVPTTRDRAEIGTIWCYKNPGGTDDAYILTSVIANSSNWVSVGNQGAETVTALTVNPGNATITAGNFEVTGGSVTFGAMGHGVLYSDAAGVITSNNGTDGQLIIAGTGVAPAFALPTCDDGSIVIVPGSNSLIFRATGATASTYVTDAGGPVSPLAGATTISGYDANITTDGATANTVKVRLADDIVAVGSVTATNDFTMLTGTFSVASDDNAAQAIYLHTNAGTLETIDIHADQGTDAASIYVHSDVGGLTFTSGLASADAINIDASDAAGGIDVDYGTGGISFVGANGAFTVESGTAAVSLGADAVAHAVTVGSTTGAASTTIQSGTGNTIITSTDAVTIDCAGVLELNSSAGVIGIGNDAVAQNINIGTGAAARTITIGNTTAASSVVVDVGTGIASFGASATDHSTTIGGTTGVSALTLQAGTGAITITAGGAFDVNAVGAVTIDSTGAAISIGAGADAFAVNIGTGAAARDISIGNATGASSFTADVGTGTCSVGASATAHTSVFGGTTGVSDTTVQSGTGDLNVTGGGALYIDGAGALEINSSAGVIGIGNDAVAQNINIGTGAAARDIVVGNITDATSLTLSVGTGDALIASGATDHTTTIGSTTGVSATTLQGGTGGIDIDSGGIVTMTAVTDTQAAAAVTVNANVGAGIFTGLTTASGAAQQLTITNSECAADSLLFVTVANLGGNDAKISLERVTPGAGSFTVDVYNNGTQALNGNIIVTFWIFEG